MPTRSAPASAVLQQIHPGDPAHPPLFLIHPIFGQTGLYRELARALPAAPPVYALRAPGLADPARCLDKIESIAAHYVQLLPASPGGYRLGGASFGGAVAFEMAQQLRHSGQTVELVFLVDTPACHTARFVMRGDTEVLWFIGEYLLGVEPGKLDKTSFAQLELTAQLALLLQNTNKIQRISHGYTTEKLYNVLQVVKAHRHAIQTYRPSPYPGKLIYFRAADLLREDSVRVHSEYFWLELAQAGIEIYTVPGNHFTMNHAPHVACIGTCLAQILARGSSAEQPQSGSPQCAWE